MSKEQLQLALWISQPILQAIIAVVVYRRRLHKDFPAFFSYTVAQIGIFAVEYPVYNWAGAQSYFYVFWISAALNVVFAHPAWCWPPSICSSEIRRRLKTIFATVSQGIFVAAPAT